VDEMIKAYILISMLPGYVKKGIDQMQKIEFVEKISVVAGQYDVIIRVLVEDLESLLAITNQLQMIQGIEKTTTQVIEKEIVL
jgi:DNA-binding Lrp family transcriptional regulator